NLASRACSMVHRYRAGVVPERYEPTELERDLAAVARKAGADVTRAFEGLQPSAALEATWTLVKRQSLRRGDEALDAGQGSRPGRTLGHGAHPAPGVRAAGGLRGMARHSAQDGRAVAGARPRRFTGQASCKQRASDRRRDGAASGGSARRLVRRQERAAARWREAARSAHLVSQDRSAG